MKKTPKTTTGKNAGKKTLKIRKKRNINNIQRRKTK